MTALGRRAAVLTAALSIAYGAAIGCEPAPIGADATRITGRSFVVDWRVEPAPLRLGEFFAVVVSACERAGQRVSSVKVDATMPAHRHGMNYAPTVTSEEGGRFRASGLLLHMPGRWEFTFDIAGDSTRETVRSIVELK
jgi:hypothetical protein